MHKMTHAEYLSAPGVSASTLKTIIENPAKLFVDQKESEAMAFGTAFHMAVLEPELFKINCVVAPQVDRRTKAGKAEFELFSSSCEGKIILSPEEYDRIRFMTDKVLSHRVASNLLDGSEKEISIFRDCSITGLSRKSRADILKRHISTVADLKTIRDCSRDYISKEIVARRYFLSAAYYLDNFDCETFVWVFVGKEPPFQVETYYAGEKTIRAGRDLYLKALAKYKMCHDFNDFPSSSNKLNMFEMTDYQIERTNND
jgi:exodeoxyribonuclease VIII